MSNDRDIRRTRYFSACARWSLYGLFVLWAAFIFATSCTVVRPQEFFDWMHENVFPDDALFRRFQVFWGFSWFAIVKGWHAGEFAVLFLLCFAALNRYTGRPGRGLGVSIVFAVAFAIADEWHQTFVPERGGTATDVVIDSFGVLVAAWFTFRRVCRADRGTAKKRHAPFPAVRRPA